MKTQRKHMKRALILRNPQAAEPALKRCQKALDAVTFDKAVERAKHAGKLRELRFAATAPVRNLIQQDKKAFRALAEVSELRKAALGGRSLNVYSQTFGPFPSFSLDLTPGLHVFSPPYDLDRPGPQTGSPTDSRADRDTGDIFANCPFDSNAHGFRAASASVPAVHEVRAELVGRWRIPVRAQRGSPHDQRFTRRQRAGTSARTARGSRGRCDWIGCGGAQPVLSTPYRRGLAAFATVRLSDRMARRELREQ